MAPGRAGCAGEAAGHDDDHGPVEVGLVVGGQPFVVADGAPVALELKTNTELTREMDRLTVELPVGC